MAKMICCENFNGVVASKSEYIMVPEEDLVNVQSEVIYQNDLGSAMWYTLGEGVEVVEARAYTDDSYYDYYITCNGKTVFEEAAYFKDNDRPAWSDVVNQYNKMLDLYREDGFRRVL